LFRIANPIQREKLAVASGALPQCRQIGAFSRWYLFAMVEGASRELMASL
jgi:hypothetical protein